MAVSTATVGWNSGFLVIASGTPAEVVAELPTGTSSGCPLENFEQLLSVGGNATAMICMYYTTKQNW